MPDLIQLIGQAIAGKNKPVTGRFHAKATEVAAEIQAHFTLLTNRDYAGLGKQKYQEGFRAGYAKAKDEDHKPLRINP